MKEDILKLKNDLGKEKEASNSLNMSKQYNEIHLKAGFLASWAALTISPVNSISVISLADFKANQMTRETSKDCDSHRTDSIKN